MARHKVGSKSEIPEGAGKAVVLDGRPVAVFHAAGKFYALDDACLHRGGPLSEGTVEAGAVVCPWHHWRFELASGRHAADPRSRVRTYPVLAEGEELFIEL